MSSPGRQAGTLAVAIIGVFGTVIICGLPMWKVTAFVGANIVTSQTTWEGLWMSCVAQSTGQIQCKIYDSLLALPPDLQAARCLTVLGVIAGHLGALLGIAGCKCTNFIKDERQKCKVTIAGGAFLFIAGLLVLIAVCWTANTVIREFYSADKNDAQKREQGASLYIGMGSAGVLVLCGGLLLSTCPYSKESYDVTYVQAQSVDGSKISV